MTGRFPHSPESLETGGQARCHQGHQVFGGLLGGDLRSLVAPQREALTSTDDRLGEGFQLLVVEVGAKFAQQARGEVALLDADALQLGVDRGVGDRELVAQQRPCLAVFVAELEERQQAGDEVRLQIGLLRLIVEVEDLVVLAEAVAVEVAIRVVEEDTLGVQVGEPLVALDRLTEGR